MTFAARSVVLVLAISLGACASAGPRVNVLGVADAPSAQPDRQTVMVFLEVVNPTKLELQLSRLEYEFSAGSSVRPDAPEGERAQASAGAFIRVNGKVGLSRVVAAGSTAVIEVPVALDARSSSRPAPDADSNHPAGAVPYSLQGRIFAMADRVERSWQVAVRGQLSARAAAAVRDASGTSLRIADKQR